MSIPYQIVRGVEFYQRKEIKDVLAYLRLLNNPSDDAAWLRVINTPPRRIGATTIARIGQHARDRGVALLAAAREADQIPHLARRTAADVAKFVALLDQLQLAGDETVEEVIGRVLHHTGYRAWLDLSQTAEDQERIENLDELLSAAREFDEAHGDEGGLEAFLEQAALVADADDWNAETDRVTMMTLHAAKGLEFPVVFIVAVEEDVLPHVRCKDEAAQLEEERRLLFVGMTRAREELHLSAAQMRTVRGSRRLASVSSFLLELPPDELECLGSATYQLAAAEDWHVVAAEDAVWQDVDAPVLDDFQPDDAWTDEGSEQAVPRGNRRRKPTGRARRRTGTAPMTTAAALAGHRPADVPPCAPDLFRQGMVVTHPEYGVGKIVALGGTGTKRSATVQFAGEQQTRRFRLAYSPLRPVAS